MSRVVTYTNRLLTHPKKTQIIVPNAGGWGTTDWVDTNEDGLADGWSKLELTAILTTIISGNGFIGNAQKVELIDLRPAGIYISILGKSSLLLSIYARIF